MAERQADGTIKLSSGRILYSNTPVEAGDVLELIEMAKKGGGMPDAVKLAVRRVSEVGTEAFFKEIAAEFAKVAKEADGKCAALSFDIPTWGNQVITSQYKGWDGRLYTFEYLYPGDMAFLRSKTWELQIPAENFQTEATMREGMNRDLKLMGIERPNLPIELWVEACYRATYISRLSRMTKAPFKEEPKGKKGKRK